VDDAFARDVVEAVGWKREPLQVADNQLRIHDVVARVDGLFRRIQANHEARRVEVVEPVGAPCHAAARVEDGFAVDELLKRGAGEAVHREEPHGEVVLPLWVDDGEGAPLVAEGGDGLVLGHGKTLNVSCLHHVIMQQLTCPKCKHEWVPRVEHPQRCPRCGKWL